MMLVGAALYKMDSTFQTLLAGTVCVVVTNNTRLN